MPPINITDNVRRRIVGALFLTQSLLSAAIIAAFTVTPIIAAQLGGGDSAAGLPSTVNLVGRAVMAYPAGWLLDRLGRRLGLSIGYLVGVAGFAVAAWSIVQGSFIGLLAGTALFGGSRGAAEQSRYVAAEIYPASRQSKVIGLVVFAGTIGAIVGPLLTAPSTARAEAAGLDPLSGPFILAAILLFLAALVLFIFLRPDPLRIGRQITDEEQKASGEAPMAARPLRQIFGRALPVLAVAAMVIGQVVMVMLMVITPLYMNHHDHNAQAISWVIMAHTLGMYGLSGLTGWLIERAGRRIMIVAGSAILVVASILSPVSTGVPLLAVALFLLGLGWNFTFVAGSSLLSAQLVTSERGRAQGAGEVAVALGAGLGSLVSGLIFARGEMIAVSIVGLALSLALLAFAAWSLIQHQPAELFAPGQD